MAPQLLFDISGIDLDHVAYGPEELERVNPHRGLMRMLDGITWISEDKTEGVAFREVRDDEFWVAGHLPGRPIFPGVLMLEAAAQFASYVTLIKMPEANFIGFAGLDKVKFRGMVVPGDRLYVLGRQTEFRRRRVVCDCQGLVNGNLAFEATVTGMPM
jgi:3-hydroxyacyl-[acyl-carrier-protein] dehydratase